MNTQTKKTFQLIGFVVIVLIILFAVSGNKVIPVPGDQLHLSALDNSSCGSCHAPGKTAPLKASHPPKEQCLLCHKLLKHGLPEAKKP